MAFWGDLLLQADPTIVVVLGILLVLSLMCLGLLSKYKNYKKPEAGPKLPPGSDLDILIVGKTGHGKSATANSILGETRFESSDDSTSVTSCCGVFQSEEDDRKLVVVDTPGLCDTGTTSDWEWEWESWKKAEEDFSTAVSFSPEGFHAILLVFRYGGRVTQEEVYVINTMKMLLGENFIKDYGLLIMTNGDDFLRKMKGQKSFQSWCDEQGGHLAVILNECQNRCLLFNNEGDQRSLKEQRIELVKMIDGMNNGQRYSEGIFKQINKKWHVGGNNQLRMTYLDVSQIYLSMVGLTRQTKTPNQMFIDEMRRRIKNLETVTSGLREGIRKKIKGKIDQAYDDLKRLEVAINKRSDISTFYNGSFVGRFLGQINGIRSIVFDELFSHIAVIAQLVRKTWEKSLRCILL